MPDHLADELDAAACEAELSLPTAALFDGSTSRCVDVGPFVLCLNTSVTLADSAYVVTLLGDICESMEAVLGPPGELDTLRFAISQTAQYCYFSWWSCTLVMTSIPPLPGFDDDRDGRSDEDPWDGRDNDGDGRTDEDRANSGYWDGTFIHELAHGYVGDIFRTGFAPHWLVEGFSEAAELFVTERVRALVGRDCRRDPFASFLAAADLNDCGAHQALGGEESLIEKMGQGYPAAAAMMILPALAEIAAGRTDPHPLARLATALREQRAAHSGAPVDDAFDQAWAVGIDGRHPVSRWLRSRALANAFVRDGPCMHLAPGTLTSGLNPDEVGAWYFSREHGDRTWLHTANPLYYTDADGHVTRGEVPPPGTNAHDVPDLAPGAYCVEAREEYEESIERGHTWILVTESGLTRYTKSAEVAVVFVGRDSLPVDPPDLEVNGRFLERVRGGAVVAPHSSLAPGSELTFRSGGRTLGSVTLAGSFLRVVPLFVDDPAPPGVLTWEPWRPAVGDTLTVWLRSGLSRLGASPSAIELRLYQGLPTPTLSVALDETDLGGLWCARFVLDVPAIRVVFEASADGVQHGSRGGSSPNAIVATVLAAPATSLLASHQQGSELLLTFADEPDTTRLALQQDCAASGIWEDAGTRPIATPEPSTWLWSLGEAPTATCGYRLVEQVEGGERILLAGAFGPQDACPALSGGLPFPTPTPDEVRWSVAVDEATSARLCVFDASGRLVDGPFDFALLPGRQEVRWRASLHGGRDVSNGVYFLRLDSHLGTLTRRSMVVRNWTR
jgi:hypothetical protein